MKKFEIITIFPKIFESYFGESIIGRAQEKKLISIRAHDLRKWTSDRHHKVDDTPYGGGAGMVIKVEPIQKAVSSLASKSQKSRVILFSVKGKRYSQRDARRLLKYDQLIFICGRYEGVDERVAKHIADEEISIGDYVLTGGEIPAMVLVDSMARLIPGVLGNSESLKDESFNMTGSCKSDSPAGGGNLELEYPQYTKPEEFKGWKVPKILLSGNHAQIEEWRLKNSKAVE